MENSRIIYTTKNNKKDEETLTKLPNYLILIDKRDDINEDVFQLMVPCTCLTKAIEFARSQKCFCTLYESITSKGTTAQYLCDISCGVI